MIPGKREGDFERRITAEDFATLPRPVPLGGIRRRLSTSYASAIRQWLLGDVASKQLIAAIRAEDPSLSERLDDLIALATASMPGGHAGDIRGQEKDAVNGLIRAFSGDLSMLREAGVVSADQPYIMAIPDGDQAIDHDATTHGSGYGT